MARIPYADPTQPDLREAAETIRASRKKIGHLHRMLLHASRLAFTHPMSGERIEAVAPLDAEFLKVYALFGWDSQNL